MKKAIPYAAGLMAAWLCVPAAAEAASATCDYNAALKRVDIVFTAPWTSASVQADADGHIRVVAGNVCGAATVTNTDVIKAVDATGTGVTLRLDLANGGLAPGAAYEPGAREIEVIADLGAGQGGDVVRIDGAAGGGHVVAGSAGVNLNAVLEPEGATGTDADVTLLDVERVVYWANDSSPAANVVTGQGARGTGGPYGGPLQLEGGPGADALWGGSGGDDIDGDAGADVLRGYSGDDELVGGAGDDVLAGGSDSDIASYSDAPSGVDVDLDLAGPQSTSGAGTDTLSEIEDVGGSAFDDELRASTAGNNLFGIAGNDVLIGRGGDDVLFGGVGDDRLRAGAGQDILEGHEGRDVADYADATSGVTLDLGVTGTYQPTGGAGSDKVNTVEDVDGSPFADVLTGDAGANALHGGDGADALTGAAGSDLLDGGAAGDQVDGADGEADQIPCDPLDSRVVDPIDALIECPAPTGEPDSSEPGTAGGPAPGTGTTGATTTGTGAVTPQLHVKVLRPTARSRKRGVRLRLVASADMTATVRLRVSRRTARRVGLRRVIVGRANVALVAGRRSVVVVAVRRKALRTPLTVRASASDAVGQRVTPVIRRIARMG